MSAGVQDADVVVTVGVDTHSETHVAAALDQFGRLLRTTTVPTTTTGHDQLVSWATGFGVLHCFGLEGTGSYGVGLARHLRARGLEIIEVVRPNRQTRRRAGKTDAVDAEIAARAVQSGTMLGEPKTADGSVEMIRTLRIARRSAMKARTQTANQLRAVLVTAPQELRDRLRKLSMAQLVVTAARMRPGAITSTEAASKLALRSLATRYQQLSTEIDALDGQLGKLTKQAAPDLVAVKGVGTDVAAALLGAAGDNPDRLRSETAFAHLCGVSPIPASSGKTDRHRLNRGGNRDANRALHLLAIGRLSRDPRTRTYAARRTAEGKSKREIIRCLKRYLAREVFKALTSHNTALRYPGRHDKSNRKRLDA